MPKLIIHLNKIKTYNYNACKIVYLICFRENPIALPGVQLNLNSAEFDHHVINLFQSKRNRFIYLFSYFGSYFT